MPTRTCASRSSRTGSGVDTHSGLCGSVAGAAIRPRMAPVSACMPTVSLRCGMYRTRSQPGLQKTDGLS